jgi:hypothetical protein
MRIAIAIAVLLVAGLVHAGKLPPPMKFNLVQASCHTEPPGPCSPNFRFASGGVVMKSIKQPQPTCPKTGQPTEVPGATVQMRGVTKSGAPFSGSLHVIVSLKTTFGDDPNANCELRNTQVPALIPSLDGMLTCKNGTCKGSPYPIACLPPQCADVPLISELGSVTVNGVSFGPVLVFDDAELPFATPGSALGAAREP